MLQERGQRLAEERELLVSGHRARRAAERALQAELEALRPELDISKVELGRLLLSSSAADGSAAQQAWRTVPLTPNPNPNPNLPLPLTYPYP